MTEHAPVNPPRAVNAACDALLANLSKLEAQFEMIDGIGLERFRSLKRQRQAEYLWTCADLVHAAKTAYLQLEDSLGKPGPKA